MKIGVPAEIKTQEGRVALTPEACEFLISQGHEVFLQSKAGAASGYSDDDYLAMGVRLIEGARELYELSELLVKVKEPQPQEAGWLRRDQLLFCYLHLAAEPELTDLLLNSGVTAVGFEILQIDHSLPLLAPMSEVAGRLAAQVSGHLLHRTQGGKGLLIGGVNGTDPGHAVVIGGGQAGIAALRDLLLSGATVTLLDINRERLDWARDQFPGIRVQDSGQPEKVSDAVASADIVIGAALIPGKRAPIVVTRQMVSRMKPGGVIVDIAIDQGGCIETSRPTSYDNPTYIEEGQVHFCVANMPGAVPRTSAQALSKAILPYVAQLASGALASDSALQGAIYLRDGEIQYAGLK
jgi:alanine dehydrogenase